MIQQITSRPRLPIIRKSRAAVSITQAEALVFDKDGTLMDLYMYWASMIDLRASFVQNELGLTSLMPEEEHTRVGPERAEECKQ